MNQDFSIMHNPNSLSALGLQKAAYIKNGDVAFEYNQLRICPSKDGDLGYLGRFQELARGIPIVLISFGQRKVHCRVERAALRVFNIIEWQETYGRVAAVLLQTVATLWTLIRAKPNVILCGTVDGSFMGSWIASKLIRCPIIFSYHTSLQPNNRITGKLRKQLHYILVRTCDMVMSNGPYLHYEVHKNGIPAKKSVMFTPTFSTLLVPSPESNRLVRKFGSYILFMGRLKKRKGIFDLLTAFSIIAPKYKDLNLVIAGTGPEQKALAKQTKRLGLDSRVFLPGRIPYEQMGGVIQHSKFVVTPSKAYMGEGICKAAVEALLLGKAIIAPNFGPFPYLITHRINGLMYRTDHVDDLTWQMKQLLDCPLLLKNIAAGAFRRGQILQSSGQSFSHGILECINRLSRNKFPAQNNHI